MASDRRAARRRAQRAAAKGRHVGPPVIVSGGGIVTELGAYDQGTGGQMPEKVDGEHRWIAVASYIVTAEQLGMIQGGRQHEVLFDHETRYSIDVGCYDCMVQPHEPAAHEPCPGDPDDT